MQISLDCGRTRRHHEENMQLHRHTMKVLGFIPPTLEEWGNSATFGTGVRSFAQTLLVVLFGVSLRLVTEAHSPAWMAVVSPGTLHQQALSSIVGYHQQQLLHANFADSDLMQKNCLHVTCLLIKIKNDGNCKWSRAGRVPTHYIHSTLIMS